MKENQNVQAEEYIRAGISIVGKIAAQLDTTRWIGPGMHETGKLDKLATDWLKANAPPEPAAPPTPEIPATQENDAPLDRSEMSLAELIAAY